VVATLAGVRFKQVVPAVVRAGTAIFVRLCVEYFG
jgi:hypothetical protein